MLGRPCGPPNPAAHPSRRRLPQALPTSGKPTSRLGCLGAEKSHAWACPRAQGAAPTRDLLGLGGSLCHGGDRSDQGHGGGVLLTSWAASPGGQGSLGWDEDWGSTQWAGGVGQVCREPGGAGRLLYSRLCSQGVLSFPSHVPGRGEASGGGGGEQGSELKVTWGPGEQTWWDPVELAAVRRGCSLRTAGPKPCGCLGKLGGWGIAQPRGGGGER